MMRTLRRLLGLGCLLVVGCVQTPEKMATVSAQFNEGSPPAMSRASIPAADESVSVRVDFVGRKVLAANTQLGMKPLFATIQSPQPEMFHVDQKVIYVTDGLVKQLPTESDLAAALSYELGRMVAERESRVKQDMKFAEVRPPIQVPYGNSGQFPLADMASTVEMAKYDKQRQAIRQPGAKPNPEILARDYLAKAGFQRGDFDHIQPLLTAADKNSALEKQIKGYTSPGNWAP